MKKKIIFYETESGKIPVKEFLDRLSLKVFKKIVWTLKLIEENDRVPKTYFKKLENKNDVWEVRIKLGSDIYRIFSFWDKGNLIILLMELLKSLKKRQLMKLDWL